MKRNKKEVEREPNSNFCHKCRKWVLANKAPKRFDIVWTCKACEG